MKPSDALTIIVCLAALSLSFMAGRYAHWIDTEVFSCIVWLLMGYCAGYLIRPTFNKFIDRIFKL